MSTQHLKDGLIDFTAGSLGGIAVVYVGQPLDTVKVKMQTYPLLYNNMVDCVKTTLTTDGISKGLYAGTVPALVCNIAENSILFFAYGFCQKFVQKVTKTDNISNLSTVGNATAGSLASLFAALAICPTELVKCKLQAVRESRLETSIGTGKLVQNILRKEGFLGFYRGFIPTVVREMPGYFFFFGGYEGTRSLFVRQGESKDDIGLCRTMFAGGVGGALFWISTYPIDVAKSRIQINGKGSLLNILVKIFKQDGFAALYHGLTPTLVRTIPATAALFVTYEYSKKYLHQLCSNL